MVERNKARKHAVHTWGVCVHVCVRARVRACVCQVVRRSEQGLQTCSAYTVACVWGGGQEVGSRTGLGLQGAGGEGLGRRAQEMGCRG